MGNLGFPHAEGFGTCMYYFPGKCINSWAVVQEQLLVFIWKLAHWTAKKGMYMGPGRAQVKSDQRERCSSGNEGAGPGYFTAVYTL